MWKEYKVTLCQDDIDLLKKAVASRMEYLEDHDQELNKEWEKLDAMLRWLIAIDEYYDELF